MNDISRQINDTADRIADALEASFAAREPGDDRAVFGIIGEDHSVSAHPLTQVRVARILKEKGYAITVAIELPHDITSNFFAKKEAWFMSSARIDAVCRNLRKLSNDHPIHLQYLAGHGYAGRYHIADYACLADNLRTRFLLREKISTCFNDAARHNYKSFLVDRSDPAFWRAINQLTGNQKRYYQKSLQIHIKGRAGMHICNLVMADFAIKRADAVKADISLLFCGAAHGAGRERFPYAESLTEILNAAGRHVTCALLNNRYTPQEAIDSPFLLPGCAIRASRFEGRKSRVDEQRFLNETVPDILPEMADIHIGLEEFQAACKEKSRAFLKSLAV